MAPYWRGRGFVVGKVGELVEMGESVETGEIGERVVVVDVDVVVEAEMDFDLVVEGERRSFGGGLLSLEVEVERDLGWKREERRVLRVGFGVGESILGLLSCVHVQIPEIEMGC